MKFLRIKFLALFLCVMCGVGISEHNDRPNGSNQPADSAVEAFKDGRLDPFWTIINKYKEAKDSEALKELAGKIKSLKGEDVDGAEDVAGKLFDLAKEIEEEEEKEKGKPEKSQSPIKPTSGSKVPATQKSLEQYFANATPAAGASGAEKVREGLRALQNEHNLDPKIQEIRSAIFDPRRTKAIHLENGFSILPTGKDDVPEVLPTKEFQRQQQRVLDSLGMKADPKAGEIILPKEFDLSQLSERDLRISGLEKFATETRPSALSDGEVLLPQGNRKFKVVDGQTYEASRKAELDTVARSGIVIQGLAFAGFKEGVEKDPNFFANLTQSLQDKSSGVHQALERLYPGFSEQVLVEAAFGKHFGARDQRTSLSAQDLPKEAPKDPRLARLWELIQKEQEIRKKFELPVGRTVIDPKEREALERQHRESVADWGREALRLAAEGIDPHAYAPPALQSHLRNLAGFTQDTAKISATNFSAQENVRFAQASFVEDLADLSRVVNPTREVKTRGAPVQWKDPARIELFSRENSPPPNSRGRFLEPIADKVSAQYNDVFHQINGPKLTSDTKTYSGLELREYVRNKANDIQGQVATLLTTAETYYGNRWAQGQFWKPNESREIDASISRGLSTLWKEARALSKQAENDPRLKPFADAMAKQLKEVERIQDKPQELANKYTRDVIATVAATSATFVTMGAGSFLFGVGQASKLVTLKELGQAAAIGGGSGAVTHVVDVGLRRWIDGETAPLTASGLALATVQSAGMGVVSRLAPGVGDLAGAYLGYQGTKASAYAAMDGKYGAAVSEGLSTFGTMAALKYIGTRSKGTASPESQGSEKSFPNPFARVDNVLTTTPYSRLLAQTPSTSAEPNYTADMPRAELTLGKKLSTTQSEAIERAHRVGDRELGQDGTPAGLGNYTGDQLQQKYNILAATGFSKAEIKKLMDDGIVGSPSPGKSPSSSEGDSAVADYQSLRRSSHLSPDKIESEMRARGHSEDEILRAMDDYDRGVEDINRVLEQLSPSTTTRKQAEEKLGKLFEHPQAKELLDTRRWRSEPTVAQSPAGTARFGPDWSKRSSSEVGRDLIEQARRSDKNLKEPDAIARVRPEPEAPAYQVSPKHVEGTRSYQRASGKEGVGVIPENHVELFRQSVRSRDDGNWYATDVSGVIHRFQEKNGVVHWNGATGGPKNPDPILLEEIPSDRRLVRKTSPETKTDVPDTQLRPGEESKLTARQQQELFDFQPKIQQEFGRQIHDLKDAFKLSGRTVPDWLTQPSVVGQMVEIFNNIAAKRGKIPPIDEIGVILQREQDLQGLMKAHGWSQRQAYSALDEASAVWTAYNGKNAIPAEKGGRGTQLHKLPGMIEMALEKKGVDIKELSWEEQRSQVAQILQEVFPGPKGRAHLKEPFLIQNSDGKWVPSGETVGDMVSKSYAATYGGPPSISHTSRYRAIAIDATQLLNQDGSINDGALRLAIEQQAKQRIVHTAQDPLEGVKFIQENARKKGTQDLPLVIQFLPGVELDPLVGHGPALARVVAAWGPSAAANDAVVRFPRDYGLSPITIERDSSGKVTSFGVKIQPKP